MCLRKNINTLGHLHKTAGTQPHYYARTRTYVRTQHAAAHVHGSGSAGTRNRKGCIPFKLAGYIGHI